MSNAKIRLFVADLSALTQSLCDVNVIKLERLSEVQATHIPGHRGMLGAL